MKIILDNGKEYEFAVGTSEHNVMQAMLNIINNDIFFKIFIKK